MPQPDTIELPPRYYRDNFLRLCDTVEQQYSDILSAAERVFLDTMRALPDAQQCLYVRLVSRAGPLFRQSKLAYDEIGPIAPAMDGLVAQGFVGEVQALSAPEAARLFTLAELRGAFGQCISDASGMNKSQLLAALTELEVDGSALRARLLGTDGGRIVAPLQQDVVDTLQLLFFGNRYQDLREFVLEDLGVVRYYPYPLERQQRLFANREALEEYLACAVLADRYRELLEEVDHDDLAGELARLAGEVRDTATVHRSSRRRYDRLCNSLARDLERVQQCDLALQLYERSTRHPARERRARILEQGQGYEAARALCHDILRDPWCEAEQEAAQRILQRVERKLGSAPTARKRDEFATIALRLQPGEGSVEQQAAAALCVDWQTVRYVENSLMNALFGLAFWEQIFAPVPGAFTHAYQSAPLDMYEPEFRTQRSGELAQRMATLQRADLAALLTSAYDRYFPCQCRWVNWRYIDRELVQTACSI
ncbi:MAG: hypothetical protein R3228_16560, partial [Halioglobus sp.]|nr:hypothetical protein [Halioglobus sp.]